jgi:hypothetical protein
MQSVPSKCGDLQSTAMLTLRTVQPISYSFVHRKLMLLSTTLPLKISSPTTTRPAVQLRLLFTPAAPPDGRLSRRRCGQQDKQQYPSEHF